jgi:hypothetical protein
MRFDDGKGAPAERFQKSVASKRHIRRRDEWRIEAEAQDSRPARQNGAGREDYILEIRSGYG